MTQKDHSYYFGGAKPVKSAVLGDMKFVMVDDHLYVGPGSKYNPDFLLNYPVTLFGQDWFAAKESPSDHEEHPFKYWLRVIRDRGKSRTISSETVFGHVKTGALMAYLYLSFDLYTLRNHDKLQKTLVDRLKNTQMFQGAKHEVYTAAVMVRAGFDIAFEDESDSSSKHVEFVATHNQTGEKIAIEAKSRHRDGVLGYRNPNASSIQGASVRRILGEAFLKKRELPLVVFVDVNLPPSNLVDGAPGWAKEVTEAVTGMDFSKSGRPEPFNFIVFTNDPYHYFTETTPNPTREYFGFKAKNPENRMRYDQLLFRIYDWASRPRVLPAF